MSLRVVLVLLAAAAVVVLAVEPLPNGNAEYSNNVNTIHFTLNAQKVFLSFFEASDRQTGSAGQWLAFTMSTDEGATWSPAQQLPFDRDANMFPLWMPKIAYIGGKLVCVYGKSNNETHMATLDNVKLYFPGGAELRVVSIDLTGVTNLTAALMDDAAWSAPATVEPYTAGWVMQPYGSLAQLSTGQLVLAWWRYTKANNGNATGVRFAMSNTAGATWMTSASTFDTNTTGQLISRPTLFVEPGAALGAVTAVVSFNGGRTAVTRSADSGMTWSAIASEDVKLNNPDMNAISFGVTDKFVMIARLINTTISVSNFSVANNEVGDVLLEEPLGGWDQYFRDGLQSLPSYEFGSFQLFSIDTSNATNPKAGLVYNWNYKNYFGAFYPATPSVIPGTPAPGGGGDDKLSRGALAGIIAGSIGGFVILALIVVKCRSSARRSEYDPIVGGQSMV